MTDPNPLDMVEVLALTLSEPVDEWDRFTAFQKRLWRTKARAVLAQIAPAIVAEAVKDEREACAVISDSVASLYSNLAGRAVIGKERCGARQKCRECCSRYCRRHPCARRKGGGVMGSRVVKDEDGVPIKAGDHLTFTFGNLCFGKDYQHNWRTVD
jgi:hypothetical protein